MKKTKSFKILVVIVILIVVALPISIYSYNQNQQTNKLKEINQAQYSFLKCISECPITHVGNQSSLKPACVNDCNVNITLAKSKEYQKYQLINNYDYVACTKKINLTDSMTFEKYQTCLINVLPTLKSKYNLK